MGNRTLYMDLNGKVKRGFENGQPYRYTSTGKEYAHKMSFMQVELKAKAHPDYEKFNRLASQRVWQNADWSRRSIC